MQKTYRIGLDIGIGSVGWAVLENNPATEEPNRILDIGVRVFDPNEVSKTGESTAKNRREHRGVRRRRRRAQFRKERIMSLIKSTLCVDEIDINSLFKEDVYMLRATAIYEKVTNAELAKIILNILKRRGFKSNRKDIFSNDDEGKLLSALNENSNFIKENGYKTIGEAIYKDEKYKIESSGKLIYNIRNHAGDYKNCFLRSDLKNELELILKKQKELGNNQITDEFIERIIYIFDKQRNFDEGPGIQSPYHKDKFEIGKCTFFPEEERASKATYTFESFTALSKINSLKIDGIALSFEQKQKLYDYALEQKEVKFNQIRKVLDLDNSKLFNLCNYNIKDDKLSDEKLIEKAEKSTFVSMKCSYDIKKALGVENLKDNKDLINEVAYMLSIYKSDERIDEYINNSPLLQTLSTQQVSEIKKLNFDKFGSLSIKAMEQIIPHLLNGDRYDIACINAGINHSSINHEKLLYLKGEKIEERLKNITSNVVKRSVNQTLKILNSIIKKYGSPQYVSIELARELSKDKQERKKIEDRQKVNQNNNNKHIERLEKEFYITKPTGFDILKLKLYEEQGGKCMYSGKEIEANRLFEPNYTQVDHILPFSRSMNDSYNNKVLVLSSENQNKGDKTPYEFFGSDEEKWNDFKTRVSLINNKEKRNFLLKQNFGEEQEKEFVSRNLNDTKYIARFMLNLMQDYLKLTPSHKYNEKVQIRSVNGAITSYLRKFWGVQKFRDDGDNHHAIDAAIISIVDPGQIQKITQFNKLREKFVYRNDKFINKETGEVMSAEEKEDYQINEIQSKLADKLSEPYIGFLKELKIRTNINYFSQEFSEEDKVILEKEVGYSTDEIEKIKPLFVSRMKNVKYTGAIHEETIMSTREYEETGKFIKTVPIQKLKLKDCVEPVKLKDDKYPEFCIENYYRPEDDRLLYLKLKETLAEKGKIPDGPFYKPRKDGTNGPLVRSVKIYEKSKGVILPNGGASNDKMHRVDVYKKDEKFYLCPVYMSDVYAKKLPNKIIKRGKDWIEIDDSYEFQFSLYKNDLIKVTSKKEIVLDKNFDNPKSKKAETIQAKEFFGYYNSTDIATGSIKFLSNDNCYCKRGLGVQNLLSFEKYYADNMGKIYKATNEKRKEF